MLDFVAELNDYYVRKRGKRIKREFREVLAGLEYELSGAHRQIYDMYIEPHLAQLQDALYEAFREAGSPLDRWREAVLENPPSIINHLAKKALIRAIREQETGEI